MLVPPADSSLAAYAAAIAACRLFTVRQHAAIWAAAKAPDSSAEMLVEVRDRARPGQFRRGFVVARRRVIVKTVLGSGIHEHLVRHARGPERRFERGIGGIDALVVFGQMA